MSRQVTVVITVRNDARGCAETLSALAGQTRQPERIVVVDGGSTDETLNVIQRFQDKNPRITVINAPGVNIASGRNIGIAAAQTEIIATTDGGCRADPDWLRHLMKPFDDDASTEFVAGFYRIESYSLLEQVVGLATMRGQLGPVDPDTFNPSARSMAFCKSAWSRAGGFPEWIRFSEDTLFDHKMRRLNVAWRFAGEAIVYWRPRTSLRAIARQFFNYGTGRGHTQIDASSFAYNLRNVGIIASTAAVSIVTPWAWVAVAAFAVYFYVWTFHGLARKVAKRTRRWSAYPLCIVVMWVTLVSNLAGYLVGTWQRRRDHDRYAGRMEAYLASS